MGLICVFHEGFGGKTPGIFELLVIKMSKPQSLHIDLVRGNIKRY